MPTASSLVRPWRSKVGGTAPPWSSAAASSAVADGGAGACTPVGGARLAVQPASAGEPGCRDQDGRERTVTDHLHLLAVGHPRRPPGSAVQAAGVPVPAGRVAIVGAVGVDAPALAVELPVQPGALAVGETVARHVPVLAVEAVLLALELAGLAAGQ